MKKKWYSFHEGEWFQVLLRTGEVFTYMHVGKNDMNQALVEINGEEKTVNEVFKGKNIYRSEVRKIIS